jgi:uncharacterized protein
MQYRKLGRIDFEVSALGFGAMRLPIKDHKVDEPEAIKMIRYAIDHGVNYIDTAYAYHDGDSELIVGKALKNGYREKVKLATKMPVWKVETAADFDRFLNEQLNKLQVDYLDFYLLHSLGKDNWARIRDLGILNWYEKTVADGRIRYPAFSFHDEFDAFKEIIDAYPWPMCLIQHNYMDIENQAGTKGLRYAAEKGTAVAIMEPLLGGNLAVAPASIQSIWDIAENKRTPVEWALQWLWNQPEVSVVLSGMSTMDQVKENIGYADRSKIGILNPAELAIIDKVRIRYQELTTIPCTDCGYCMPCPQNVDIPQNIANYNNGIMFDQYDAVRGRYKWWKHVYDSNGFLKHDIRAVNCTSCGECEEKCPQGIPISRWMPVIHEVFEQKKPFVKKLEEQ